MTTDDIAWVQGRLRDCKYLHSTLQKCAQSLDVDVSELLAALGYESEAALQRAYPDKLPQQRMRPNQIKKKEQLKMDIDAKGLPAFCYAIGPKTGAPVKIVRGDTVMYGVRGDTLIDKVNDALGVDARMAAAMVGGVLHGWDSDYAAPVNYDDDGVYIGARKE